MGFVSLASSQSQYFSVLVVFFFFFSPWSETQKGIKIPYLENTSQFGIVNAYLWLLFSFFWFHLLLYLLKYNS